MANIPIMAVNHDIHALHTSEELPASPASELKNSFKGVFQQALREGAISITRNRKREAILLSAELYDRIISELAARDPLKTLRNNYEVRFAAMQTEKGQAAYEDAFGASPEELGKAAVAHAEAR
jgi:PHD/YefM family antitoxin component YafN of YafNO toxin-antitoxin module